MLVLAAVSGPLLPRLQYAGGERFRFVAVRSWEDALSAILSKPIELGVLDPALEGPPRSQEIERLKVLFPSFPIILYTGFSPAVAPVLLRLGEAGIRQVVIARHDDHPTQLSQLLAGEAARAVSGHVMNALADLFGGCPAQLQWAIQTAIREPVAVQTVQDLAARARMDRRTCVRWFAKAKLPPPSVILMVLRVIYAHRLFQDPGYTVEDVARKLGYAQIRSLQQNVREVLGVTPGELRVSLTPEEALTRLRNRYFPTTRAWRLAKVS